MGLKRTIGAASIMLASSLAVASPQPAWHMSVGVAPIAAPFFAGSKDYAFSVFPDIRARYGRKFSVSVPEGARYNLISNRQWQIGPMLFYRFSRRESRGSSPFRVSGDTNALQGLGDIKGAFEAGAFARYRWRWLQAQADLRKGFGGHKGVVGNLDLSYNQRLFGGRFGIGPSISFGTKDFMQTYYGIDATQSANSGLNTYQAKGGIEDYGVRANWMKRISNKLSLLAFASYRRLGSQAADSPLVTVRGNPNQYVGGMALSYEVL